MHLANGNELWNDIVFNNSPDDDARSIIQALDGGYITIGYTDPKGNGIWDAWLIKVDDSGNKLWDRIFYPASQDYHSGYCMTQSVDDGYVLTGDVLPNGSGAWNVWLAKVDVKGN